MTNPRHVPSESGRRMGTTWHHSECDIAREYGQDFGNAAPDAYTHRAMSHQT